MVVVELDKGTDTKTDMWSTDDRGTAYVKRKDGLDVDDVAAWNCTKDREVDSGGVAVAMKVDQNSN